MKASLMSCVKTVLCGLATAVFGLLPAQAENYYLSESASGVAADFGDPATYGCESGLPGSGDLIYVNDNLVLKVTDANVASLSARGTTVYCTTKAKVEIDLAEDAELKAQFTYSGSSECAGVTKTGAGTLTLTLIDNPTYDDSARYVGCKNRWHVLGGTLVFPQTGYLKTATTFMAGSIEIAAGCQVVNAGCRLAASLNGAGDLVHRSATATRITLAQNGSFYGNILQADGAGNVQIYVSSAALLYGAGGTASSAAVIEGGLVGLGKFGQSGSPSTLGMSSKPISVTGNAHVLALGAAEETTNKPFQPNANCTTFEMDGGAFGGVTFTGAWDPTGAIMRSLVLSGSNTEHACVLQNTIADVGEGADACSYHLVKKGTGVWRMSSANPKWSGAMTIEEGTLQFDSIAPAGTACSLGFATNLYANVPGTKDEANRVDWAVRLGNPGAGEVATLEYAGTAAAEWPTSRPIVVDGRGRFRNETGSAFTLAGVTAATAGSSLSLDGDAASGNKLNGVSDGAGTLKIVKEGEGDWTLAGTVDVSGGLDVRAGTLKVANRKNYDWFKVITKQTFAGATGATGGGSVSIQEFALYDINGVRQNLNPQIGDPQVGAAAGTLVPGGLAYGPCASGSETAELVNMTHANTSDQWTFKFDAMPDPGNSDTWVSFVVRVPEGTPEIEKFDLRYWKKSDSSGNLYQPKILTIEGSTDGLCWTHLTTVTNPPVAAGEERTSTYYWIYGDKVRYDADRDPENSGLAFETRAIVPDAERPDVSIGGGMSVASSAGLRIVGEPLEISRLELDFAAGIGSFDNLRLASSGTIVVKNASKGAVTIPADFSGVANFDAIGEWAVVDEDGKPFRKKLEIRRDSVSIVPNGLMLIFR